VRKKKSRRNDDVGHKSKKEKAKKHNFESRVALWERHNKIAKKRCKYKRVGAKKRKEGVSSEASRERQFWSA
jgi:hypothetical protein